jgi:hypothetical protein
MLKQLYWTLWGASSAQKEQPRPEPKYRCRAQEALGQTEGAESLKELRPPPLKRRWPS